MKKKSLLFQLLFFYAVILPGLLIGSPIEGSQAMNSDSTPRISLVFEKETSPRASGSITTLYYGQGGYAGNMFDIEPLMLINEITALDVNFSTVGETLKVHLFYRVGTSVGYELDSSTWLTVAVGSAVSSGLDNPTFVDISGNNVSFETGQVYGIYVHVDNYSSLTGYLAYTKNQHETYSNNELILTSNCSNGDPAFSTYFFPRIWNGTLYYDFTPSTVTVYPGEINVWTGGSAEFKLLGDPSMAGRSYVLLGGASGTSPGTELPGGMTLPLNWDLVTKTLLILAMSGHPLLVDFIGELDANGQAQAVLTMPGGYHISDPALTNFAWCTYSPYDFVSNSVDLWIISE